MSAEHPEASTDRSSARRHVVLALKIVVSIVLLTVLFSRIDVARLWSIAGRASLRWFVVALAVYAVNMIASTWRWYLLLRTQQVDVRRRWLFGSFLVASFFNNFLPSNIGGDVIRISDTARATRSRTLAATVVLMDRVIGLIALILVAAIGATAAGAVHPAALPIWPMWLWAGLLAGAAASAPAVLAPVGFTRLLQPLTVFHPEWVGSRIDTLIEVLLRFRARPGTLARCFVTAVFVQVTMVMFYFSVIYALHLSVPLSDIAVIVPISFVTQMLPVSFGGFGVREATFSIYFSRIGQPIESAIAMSLIGQALIILFSLSGAAVYVSRKKH